MQLVDWVGGQLGALGVAPLDLAMRRGSKGIDSVVKSQSKLSTGFVLRSRGLSSLFPVTLEKHPNIYFEQPIRERVNPTA